MPNRGFAITDLHRLLQYPYPPISQTLFHSITNYNHHRFLPPPPTSSRHHHYLPPPRSVLLVHTRLRLTFRPSGTQPLSLPRRPPGRPWLLFALFAILIFPSPSINICAVCPFCLSPFSLLGSWALGSAFRFLLSVLLSVVAVPHASRHAEALANRPSPQRRHTAVRQVRTAPGEPDAS